MRLDQRVSLLISQVERSARERLEVTVYLHHSLADAHHVAGLLDELFSRYTDVVTTGDPGPIIPAPAPQSMELCCEQRGIKRAGLTGVERFLPVMFAYDFPAHHEPSVDCETWCTPTCSRHPSPSSPSRRQRISWSSAVKIGLSVNSVVAAAILLTEWRLRNTPHVPIPYCYPVDLRYFLNPPVNPTEVPTWWEWQPTSLRSGRTPISSIWQAISVPTFRADLADGLIQQSALDFGVDIRRNSSRAATICLLHRCQCASRPCEHPRALSWKTFRANSIVRLRPRSTSTPVGSQESNW